VTSGTVKRNVADPAADVRRFDRLMRAPSNLTVTRAFPGIPLTAPVTVVPGVPSAGVTLIVGVAARSSEARSAIINKPPMSTRVAIQSTGDGRRRADAGCDAPGRDH
jgi:hypothetical protein